MTTWGRARRAGVALLVVCGPASAQSLPDVRPERYPAVARGAITEAITDARAHPQDPARLGQLGMLLHAWQQWDAAAEAYARARALERRFDWYYLGGVIAARQARYSEAAALLRDAVSLSPAYTPARLKLADALLESGALDEAEREYRRALDDPRARPHAHYGIGRVLAARGDDAAALAQLEAAVQLYPEFGAAWYARGLAERRLGHVDQARESLVRARAFGARWPGLDDPVLGRLSALRDDPAARVDRGLQLERRDDLDGAIREYQAALAQDSAFTPAHVQLIRAYGRRGDWTQSEAHYREAIRQGGEITETEYSHGVTLLLQGRDADAAAALQRVVAANPQHAAAWNALGQVAERAGQIDEALQRYRTAHECAPSDAAIRFNLARLLIATRQYAEAIAQFEILASDTGPEQPRYTFGLATALVQSGDLARGRRAAIDARRLAAARGQMDLVADIDRDLAKLPGGGRE